MSDISEFSYSNSTFSKASDSNPVPTISGACGGLFSSTTGISLDVELGIIELLSSNVGDYEITYTVSDGLNSETSKHSITISP